MWGGHFSPWACCLGHSGPMKHGGTIGRGIPRKHGQLPHGLPIWLICTTVFIPSKPIAERHCGCWLYSSLCCKCAGGASIICRQPKVQVFIRIILVKQK